MKWSLEKSIALGLGLVCTTLITLGVAQAWVLNELRVSSDWVTHTDEVLTQIEATMLDTATAQALARGYALSEQSYFLASLTASKEQANMHEQSLRHLTSDNPRQQRRLDTFETLLTHEFSLLDELIQLRKDKGIQAAGQFVSDRQEPQVMLQLRTTANELRGEENYLLKIRNANRDEGLRKARRLFLVLTLSGLGFMLLACLIVSRDIKVLHQTERELEQEKHLLDSLLDSIPDAVYFKDLESRFTRINRALARRLGLNESSQAQGKTDADFFSEEHAKSTRRDELEILQTHRPILNKQERETWPDKSHTWVTTSKMLLSDPDGRPMGTFGISADITARKKGEEALEQANEKLKDWVSVLQTQDEESITLAQLGELLQTCITEEEAHNVVGQFARTFFPDESGAVCIIKASRNLVETVASWGAGISLEPIFAPDHCWALRRGRIHCVGCGSVRLTCAHVGEEIDWNYLCVPMMAHGEALGILHLAWDPAVTVVNQPKLEQRAVMFSERVALALANLKLQQALRAQSIRDPLTGLYNRRYLEESLERELRRAERNGKPVGAILIDLDHFKRFNDTFGHEAGDVVLREFGELLRKRTRKEDIACRLGGEEFIIILPDASLENTYRRAEELRETVKSMSVTVHGQSLGTITTSMGIAMFPDHAQTVEALMRAADTALYHAKENGRDRAVLAIESYV
jgi:diguanylate cyclase (GGDEF)-like protein/PAS domain S-box-containing protein